MSHNPKEDPNRIRRLVLVLKKGERIFLAVGGQEVEIKIAESNPSIRAKICFDAPASVEIVREKLDGTIQGGNHGNEALDT